MRLSKHPISRRIPALLITFLFAQLSYGENEASSAITDAHGLCLNNQFQEAQYLLATIQGELDPFQRAREQFVRGVIAIGQNDEDQAEDHFSEMERIAYEEVVPIAPADGNALQAQARARLMLIKGIPYIIRSAGIMEKLALAALEEDPDHVAALLVLAQGKINAPRIFGGDIEFGIECLERVLVLAEQESPERFAAYLGLSESRLKQKQYKTALSLVDAALAIHPGNPEAIRHRAKILKKIQE